MTSLQATWSRGNIYTLLTFRDLQGWEKAAGTGSSHLIALPVLFLACGTRHSGSRQGNKHLALPCSIPAWALWSLHCHPSPGEGSLSDCTLQHAVCNIKFVVQGFPSLVPGTGA